MNSRLGGRWATSAMRSALVLPLLIGTFAVYGAFSVYSLPLERVIFGVIVLAALVLSGVGFRRSRAVPPVRLASIWVAGCALWLVLALFQPEPQPLYIGGDLLLAATPLVVAWAYTANPQWFAAPAPLRVLLFLLAMAAVIAPVVGRTNHRNDPPSALLIAGAWYFLLQRGGNMSRGRQLLLAAGVLGVGFLCYLSGYRTHIGLWILAPALIALLLKGRRTALLSLAAVVVAGGAFTLLLVLDPGDVVAHSRFETLVNGQGDESTSTRVDEADDVMSTAREEWSPVQALVGAGFGASYVPKRSYVANNVAANGRVHNIHLGPVLVFFRFGVLGLILFYGVLMGFVVRCAHHLSRAPRAGPDVDFLLVLALTVLLYFVQCLVLNSTVEPPFTFSIGVMIAAWTSGLVPRNTTPPAVSDGSRPTGGDEVPSRR